MKTLYNVCRLCNLLTTTSISMFLSLPKGLKFGPKVFSHHRDIFSKFHGSFYTLTPFQVIKNDLQHHSLGRIAILEAEFRRVPLPQSQQGHRGGDLSSQRNATRPYHRNVGAPRLGHLGCALGGLSRSNRMPLHGKENFVCQS